MPQPLTSGMPPPLAVTLPSTEYFEIDSASAGDRFAVWVTRPVDYDRGGEACYPAIYVTDGNVSAAMLSPYAEHTAFDLIGAFQPHDRLHPVVPELPAGLLWRERAQGRRTVISGPGRR